MTHLDLDEAPRAAVLGLEAGGAVGCILVDVLLLLFPVVKPSDTRPVRPFDVGYTLLSSLLLLAMQLLLQRPHLRVEPVYRVALRREQPRRGVVLRPQSRVARRVTAAVRHGERLSRPRRRCCRQS